MSARRYAFHGVTIAVDAGGAPVEQAIDDRLRLFRDRGDGTADLVFSFAPASAGGVHVVQRPAGASRPVYDPPVGEVSYFDATQQLYIDVEDRIKVLCSLADGRVAYSVARGHDDLWMLSRPLFTIPLVELMKRHGRFSVHAAAVAAAGRAIVLAGASGSGKSTLAVALTRAGFDFLADDMIFLSGAGEDVRALAFPDEIDVTDRTAGFFPELRHVVGRTPDGWPKHRVRHEDAFGAGIATDCHPGLLVFPSIGGDGPSVLERLEPHAALLELAPNVLLTEAASSQQHLDALAALTSASRCYRLTAGRDFERVADLLRAELAA